MLQGQQGTKKDLDTLRSQKPVAILENGSSFYFRIVVCHKKTLSSGDDNMATTTLA